VGIANYERQGKEGDMDRTVSIPDERVHVHRALQLN